MTGIVLLLIAQCFTGGQFVSEEKLLSGTSLDPLYVVGLEGFWGCCVFAVLLPIFQQVECYGTLCHNGRLEDSLGALQEYREHPILYVQSICNIVTIAGFNVTGVMITKYASAAQRSTIDTCRTMIIWLVFLALGSEKFLAGELVGFVLLVLGTLVYNEIIEVPIGFMSRNTKRNLEARETPKDLEKAIEDKMPTGETASGTSDNSDLEEKQKLLSNKMD